MERRNWDGGRIGTRELGAGFLARLEPAKPACMLRSAHAVVQQVWGAVSRLTVRPTCTLVINFLAQPRGL